MKITEMTIGLPVTDLAAATAWYARLLEREGPDLEPVPEVAEFDLGHGRWVQLGQDQPGPGRWVLRFGVPDLDAELHRLQGLGIEVEPPIEVPGVITLAEFTDPDGNRLCCYTLAG